MGMLGPLQEQLVKHNAKVKVYPDGSRHLMVATRPIFKDEGWELIEDEEKEFVSKPKDMTKEDVRWDSAKRAKEKAIDIARLNDFSYFTTWTLNKELIDRYDRQQVKKKLRNFLRNGVQRKDLMYLVIPEYHEDGAIHMHGLIRGDYQYVDSGLKTKRGQIIYNMPDWSWGFSTAVQIGSKEGAIRYVSKYITKENHKIFGSFYLAGGHGLVRTPHIETFDMDFNSLDVKSYLNPEAKIGFKYLWEGSNDVSGQAGYLSSDEG